MRTHSKQRIRCVWLACCLGALFVGFTALPTRAVILWSDLGATLAHNSGNGVDVLRGAVQRDDLANDTLYFKFHVDPLSDSRTEEYLAAFQLFQGGRGKLGIGNSLKAWAYSAFNTSIMGEFNTVSGDLDLNSARPESSAVGVFFPYEFPRRGIESTIVFKVRYIRGGEDQVTVWLNPDLSPGATEESQSPALRTTFTADAAFDAIHIRHEGGGGGWIFSDMAIATAFNDFVRSGLPFTPVAGSETNRDAAQFTFRVWQREQGLPQNAVRALAQTPDGYLWLGTDEGVTRFDGDRFVSFGLREGLRGHRVRTLCASQSGALWIGTSGGGLARLEHGRFHSFQTADGLPSNTINILAEDDQGQLWVGTDAGLVVWKDWRPVAVGGFDKFKGADVTALFKDRTGRMWVGVRGDGVFQFQGEDEGFERLADASVEELLADPHCVLVDQAGRVWVGAGDDYVLCREGGEWRRFRIPRNLARPYIVALAEEPDGTVWAGSVSEGLFRFRDGKLATITASRGLSESAIESLLVDDEGMLWVGTGAGLNRLHRRLIAAYGPSEGLGFGAVQSLAEVSPGVIWAAKLEEGLFEWSPLNWGGKPFRPLDLGRAETIHSLLAATDGSCWFASASGLFQIRNPRELLEQPSAPVAPHLAFTALAEAGQGQLWAGTRNGELWTSTNGQWNRHITLPNPRAVTAIVTDPGGVTWVGTDGDGLHGFRHQPGATRASVDGLLSATIRTLFVDDDGVLWIGTAGGGLGRWHENQLVTYTTAEGLPGNTISQILEDDEGRLWLGHNRGLASVSKRELADVAQRKIPALAPHLFNRKDGMLSEECMAGYFPAALKTRSGLLCFPTTKGIAVVNPRRLPRELPAPRVLIEELVLDGVVHPAHELTALPATGERGLSRPVGDPSASLRLAPGRHQMEFHYTALNFAEPEQVRFRHRLEGLEADWVEAGARRTAFYTYVPPGDYRFRVAARVAGGPWSEASTSVAFTVLPHFWQTWWFIGLMVIGVLGGVAVTVRVVEKRKHQRRVRQLEQQHALERERARIAQDLHDDLGSSLARISLLSSLARADQEEPAQVAAHVSKIAQSADDSVRALEEIVWAVRPGSDTLQSLVEYIAHFANELFEGDGTRCRLDLPHDLPARPLPPDMRHNIFLIVKEALTNVFKHAQAREVHVQAQVRGDQLEIQVSDDGQGFDPARVAPGAKHNGLVNMRRRAEVVGGRLDVRSNGSGTVMRLAIRLPEVRPNQTS